jgi:hypothetical protein
MRTSADRNGKPLPSGVNIHIPTPELDKMLAVKDKSQAIGEFLDWLKDDQGIVLAKWEHTSRRVDEVLVPNYTTINGWLAKYFEIDENKCEKERRALLDAIHAAHEATA